MTTRSLSRPTGGQDGSALVVVLIVLTLLSLMGITLLFTADSDVKMNQAGARAKKAFYNAEAGLEVARRQLRDNNLASGNKATLSDELATAAGANATINLDPSTVKPTFDASGSPTGFTGYGDDVPLVASTAFGGGRFAAFVTNDASDGSTSLTDSNHRVMITAVGAGPNYSSSTVQAIVANNTLPTFPAAITLLGNTPNFDGGNSNAKTYTGNDCQGATGYTGVAGASVPVVGAIGATAVTGAQSGVNKPGAFTSGALTGTATVQNVSGTIDPNWLNCSYLQSLAATVKASADYVCTVASPCSHWATATISTITFVEGDVTISAGKGVLWVTGTLTISGSTDWEGTIIVVGKGVFQRNGGGGGHTYGAELVANITGPDGVYGTADDCTGGNAGFGPVTHDNSGGGTHDTAYCSDAIAQSGAGFPLRIVDFRQR
jgi:Tfp pilus assembly protein PilX